MTRSKKPSPLENAADAARALEDFFEKGHKAVQLLDDASKLPPDKLAKLFLGSVARAMASIEKRPQRKTKGGSR
jgi:hypothetical protein